MLTIVFAKILCGEYPELVGSADVSKMQRLIQQAEATDDPIDKIAAMKRLKDIADQYPVLITLFTIKLSANSASKVNPSDANRLLQLHDEIVQHFKNRQSDEGFALMEQALDLRDKYGSGGIDIGSIHLS